MAKIKKIGLLILPAAIAVAAMFYLCRISVGFRISAICSLLTLSGLGTKTSPDYEYYKRMRNKNNPLFQNDCFRKKRGEFLSDLKGMHYCQVYILLQTTFFMLYGVFTAVTKTRWYLFEIFMIVFAWLPMPMSQAIQYHYNTLIKQQLKKRAQIRKTDYFALHPGKAEGNIISIPMKEIQGIESVVSSFYKEKGFIFWGSYTSEEAGEIQLYFSDKAGSLEINLALSSNGCDTAKFFREINEIILSFIREFKGSGIKVTDTNLSLIIYTDNIDSFSEILNRPVIQSAKRLQILAVISINTGTVYLSSPIGTYDTAKYAEMKHELLKSLTAACV